MMNPSSDRFLHSHDAGGSDELHGLEVGRARGVLKLSLAETPRPIDELLHQLEQPESSAWLMRELPAHIHSNELTDLLEGRQALYAIIERKDRSKTFVVEATTKDSALASLALYCLCVASAVVHYNQLISTQSWRTWQAFLADLADVAPEAWRPLLFDAAVKVEHARTSAA